MDKLTKEWQEKFEKVWTGPEYRMGSPGQRLVKRFSEYAPPGCVVNDYGSGTGRAAVELIRLGYKVNMVDLAPNALEDEARSLLSNDLTFTQASLWDLPRDFPVATWGYCMEVLQLLPLTKLLPVLTAINFTCANLFVQVAGWADKWLGVDVNIIVEDAEWWESQLLKVWENVSQIPSLETSKRYIFICRGKI